jgi:hypothetical protein
MAAQSPGGRRRYVEAVAERVALALPSGLRGRVAGA